jgi:hypothetical protein
MASIPTASVDALVHVKRLRRPKKRRVRSLSAQVEWCKLDQIVRFTIVQSVADCRDHETISVVCVLCVVCLCRFGQEQRREQRKVKMSDGPMISATSRKLVLAAFASLVLVTVSTGPSAATSSTLPAKAVATGPAASSATDFSAARRHRYYRRGPNAAGLAFMGVAAGLIGGAIAESQRREYYEDHYYYGPRPYYGGPGYYGGGPYYGQRGYYQPY